MPVKVYHGSKDLVEFPEIRMTKCCQDFYYGFYCTFQKKAAERQAAALAEHGFISEFLFVPKPDLIVRSFPKMSDEWLDFIAACRLEIAHDYDIVEGPMVDHTISREVKEVIDGKISRDVFWELVKGRKPACQLSFHSARALSALEFVQGYPF